MHISSSKKLARLGRLALVMGVLPLAWSPGGQAAVDTTDFSGFDAARQLSNEELGNLRGRFVDRGRLMYFGIRMDTSWRTPAGDHVRAGAALRGDLSGNTPRMTFKPYLNQVQTAESGMNSPSGAVLVDAGTSNVKGVAQTIQAGGDYNVAANDMTVDIMGVDRFDGMRGNGSAIIDQRLPSGMRISIDHSGSNSGIQLSLPGVGNVQQHIVPGRGLRQAIQLSSNHHRVHNITQLQLYMDRSSLQTDSVGMRHAVESARRLSR